MTTPLNAAGLSTQQIEDHLDHSKVSTTQDACTPRHVTSQKAADGFNTVR
ncbi:MAG: hypothetical protein ABWY11_25430 [Umezawaea sp.]